MPLHKLLSVEKYLLSSKTHATSLPCFASVNAITKDSVLKTCKLIVRSKKRKIKPLWSIVNILRLHDHLSYFNVERSSPLVQSLDLFTGVPEGSILVLLLFNIFLNDIFLFISKCQLCNYADDDTLYKSGKNMQKIKNDLQHRYSNTSCLSILLTETSQ